MLLIRYHLPQLSEMCAHPEAQLHISRFLIFTTALCFDRDSDSVSKVGSASVTMVHGIYSIGLQLLLDRILEVSQFKTVINHHTPHRNLREYRYQLFVMDSSRRYVVIPDPPRLPCTVSRQSQYSGMNFRVPSEFHCAPETSLFAHSSRNLIDQLISIEELIFHPSFTLVFEHLDCRMESSSKSICLLKYDGTHHSVSVFVDVSYFCEKRLGKFGLGKSGVVKFTRVIGMFESVKSTIRLVGLRDSELDDFVTMVSWK